VASTDVYPIRAGIRTFEKMCDRLDQKAIARVSGPAWAKLKPAFLQISETLLGVSPQAASALATIYVKYLPSTSDKRVFAVVWIKTSKQILVGLSLPNDFDSQLLGEAPKGTKYAGLTKYFTVTVDDDIPTEFLGWAKSAYENRLSTDV
jgi:hypothetical protein